jgi:AraC-like DNA-binding protein
VLNNSDKPILRWVWGCFGLRVRSIEVSFGIAHSLVERFCAFVKVLYLISGELIVCANGKKHTMYPEDIIVINPGDQYSINADSKAVLFDIKFDRDVFESIGVSRAVSFDCILTAKSTDRSAKEGNDLRNHIQVLIYSYLKNGSDLNAEVMANCYEVLNCLLSSFESTAHAEKNDDEEMLDRRIREIAGYVQENYSEKIMLSNFAKKYFISDSHLSRLFRNAFGITFREYLINVRLEAAERELHKKNKSIIRVANDTGFSSLAAFNRSFKEKFGYTPSEFKDTIENDASAQSERREAQNWFCFKYRNWGSDFFCDTPDTQGAGHLSCCSVL